MWGKPPFAIAENCAVDARQLSTLCEWYEEKLGLRDVHSDREEDSGRAFKDLSISRDQPFLSLLELEPGGSAEKRHVIFFAKNLEKAQQWLADCGVAVEPTTTDSGGNRLFRFQDLEGNLIEVCVEP
jgi:catechol 2,3-dioxygenase-like lactoylglutathione lyase family enzyme